MKKFRIIFISLFLALTGLIALSNLFLDINLLNLSETRNIEKSRFGGIVSNETSHEIKIVSNTIPVLLPENKTSRDIRIFDADGILINKPTIYKDKIYKYGVVKICDIASAKVTSTNGIDKISESPVSGLCGLFDKVGWYPSIKDGFPPPVNN